MFGKNLSITGQDPSVSKSNRLHVDIFSIFLHQFEIYSIHSYKMIGKFLKSWTSTSYFSNSTGSSATNHRFSPDIGETWQCFLGLPPTRRGPIRHLARRGPTKITWWWMAASLCRLWEVEQTIRVAHLSMRNARNIMGPKGPWELWNRWWEGPRDPSVGEGPERWEHRD